MKDNFILSVCVSAFVLFLLPCNCFNVGKRSFSINRLSMTSTPPSNPPKKGIGFNYDPSDFRDSNSGNYRRLSDRMAAKKAEDEKLEKEREELIRKEQMEKFEKEQMEKRVQELLESDEIIATPEDVVIDPAVEKIFEDLDNELIGLQSVKDSLRRYVALLAMDKIRRKWNLPRYIPPLHHIFTGNPGTGKTTVAMKLSELYHKTGLISSGHTVVATRADLVGQYIGHTGPKTKEMILKSFGGILFIDEAYGLYKEESRDYGSEVLSMLIKFIDNTPRTDFVVVMAGYHDRMENMMSKNIRLFNRIGNWIDFPDYNEEELLQIAEVFVKKSNFRFGPKARGTFAEFMKLRKEFPYFSNARTVRNAIEKARTIAASRAITDMVERDVIYSEQDVFTLRSSDFQKMIDTIKDMPRDSQLP